MGAPQRADDRARKPFFDHTVINRAVSGGGSSPWVLKIEMSILNTDMYKKGGKLRPGTDVAVLERWVTTKYD